MRLCVYRHFFTEKERLLLSHGAMKVTAFRFSTGVEALRVENPRGNFVILPFQGQQIWSLNFDGRELGMRTTVKEPVPNVEYLRTYGGFFYHCGISAFGSPQAEDKHPQHGETPNIAYNEAYIDLGEDENGKYIAVSGLLDYDIAFVRHYHFEPSCRLYENASVLKMDVKLTNMRADPMEYMYLAHINFLPIDGARLIYSAKHDAEHMKVHKIVSPALSEERAQRLSDYMDRLQEDPAVGDSVGAPDQCYDPEICSTVRFETDDTGRAYSLQYAEGQGACYVSHPADVLPYGIRWVSRTPTEDSMGMVLPATAEHFGYTAAKRAGTVRLLPGGETLRFTIEAGWLDDSAARAAIDKIQAIMNKE